VNRWIFAAIVFAIGVIGPASAGTMYRGLLQPDVKVGTSVGGFIFANGHVLEGNTFTSQRTATGEYDITFKGQFGHEGCGALVANGWKKAVLIRVLPRVCSPNSFFTVEIFDPATGQPTDAEF
jgi:hypothetical protein